MKLQAGKPGVTDETDKGVFDLLDRLNIRCGSKWYALILFMRSIRDFDTYTVEQKSRMQELVVQVLKEGNLSEEAFQDTSRKIEEILSLTWRRRLQEALGEISRLIRESRSMILRRKGDLEVLETNTVETLQSGRDIDAVIDDIRLGFQDVVRLMEKDADDLVRQSRTDQLTGLGNRRAFDEMLEKAVDMSQNSNKPLYLLMVDVDHFKAFNDTYGHLIGDQALAAVASVLRDSQKQAVRAGKSVFCARFGGEEFTVLVLGGSPTQALNMAELIRKHIENYNFVIRDVDGGILTSGIKLTVSVGVALFNPDWLDSQTQRLIQASDEALYAAKNAGRNRVFMARIEA
ncbi:GGDEF domain-containing protein [Fundidesulfovibrio butyratiphilus]